MVCDVMYCWVGTLLSGTVLAGAGTWWVQYTLSDETCVMSDAGPCAGQRQMRVEPHSTQIIKSL